MTPTLPPNPSLENLKKQAKSLQKSWQNGDPAALARVRAHHPKFTQTSDQTLHAIQPKLTDCQLILAREHGMESWPELKAVVESAKLGQVQEFVTIACLCFDDPHYDHRTFHQRAHQILQADPALAGATIWSAAAAGNTAAIQIFLEENPGLVNRPGPHGWSPLICACYSRVAPVNPAHSTFEAAKLLLDRGADPN